jgi:integrase
MALYAWAMQQGLVEANPVIGTGVPDQHVKPRERVLSESELVKVWQASGDDSYGVIVKLLILTGCRRQEVGSMQWGELDQQRGIWNIPAKRTKNGRTHALPLPDMARAILAEVPRWHDGAFVFGRTAGFQAWAKSKRALDQRADVAPFVVHDIRRSVATHMNEIGVQPHIVSEVLGHARPGVTGTVYNKATYSRDIAVALERWADHIRALVEGGERQIIPLRS